MSGNGKICLIILINLSSCQEKAQELCCSRLSAGFVAATVDEIYCNEPWMWCNVAFLMMAITLESGA